MPVPQQKIDASKSPNGFINVSKLDSGCSATEPVVSADESTVNQ